MNVCLLNDSFPPVIDGVANVVLNYAKVMTEDQLANVVVGTPKYPGADYSSYSYPVIPYQSFDTTKLANGYRAGNPIDIHEVDVMAERKPDIIHSHSPFTSTILARLLRAKVEQPLVFTYHTKFDQDIAKAVGEGIVEHAAIKAIVSNIEACDEVWVVSNGAGENLKSLGYKGDYRVVDNGVDFAKGRVADEDVAEAVKGYDLPKDVPMFLFVGRIVKYKGIPLILDAMKKFSDEGNDFRMVFVGSGPDEKELKEQARQCGLLDCDGTDKCIFVGAIHDRNKLRAWNTRADVFIFPSTYDTNGIVVREAAACGLASILIKGSCAAEGITDGRNGYTIEKTVDALCAKLGELCKDLDNVHEVGQHAMDEIYISWKDCVHIACQRYGEIIDLKKSGKLVDKTSIVAEKMFELSGDVEAEFKKLAQFSHKLGDEVHELFHQ